jgi:hypothetical protein
MKLDFQFGWDREVEAYVLRIQGNQIVLGEQEFAELLEVMEKGVAARDTE